MGRKNGERVRRRELMKRLLLERDREGLTLVELAQRSGIPSGTLAGWVTRLRRESQVVASVESPVGPAGFVEIVPTMGDCDASAAPFEVMLKRERRVVVPATFDESALVRLVRVLEAC